MNWFISTPLDAAMAGLSATAMFLYIILLTRLSGLRSFSKFSAFDFAVTVAIGSILAGTVVAPNPPLALAMASLAFLFLLQIGTAWLRSHFQAVSKLIDNKPLLLMDGGEMLHENLKAGKISVADVYAKLREANVIEWSEIKAVVLESTGDISVLHGPADALIDKRLMHGLRSRAKIDE